MAQTTDYAGRLLHVGLDIGSTTTKAFVLDPSNNETLFWRYKRHNARQAASAAEALRDVGERFPGARLRVAVTGSGARDIAQALNASYIQEVVANSIAIRELYPQVRCAIELGGQDAKMIFFHADDSGTPTVSDMRMNGSCAGGTGAFIDEMAKLLGVPSEGFEELAAQGTTVYEISGRCGVYAKTDVQPLLNQGVSRADLALSAMHAVARQTIGGLAQGIDIEAPVIFEGGTLAYNPTLVKVFREQLDLTDDDVVVPQDPQVMIARGAALSLAGLFADEQDDVDPVAGVAALEELQAHPVEDPDIAAAAPFFATDEEREEFERRHPAEQPAPGPAAYRRGEVVHAYLGIDSGSTTTKFALVDAEGGLIDSFYASNEGKPLDVARRGLLDLKRRWDEAGVTLAIDAVGTTGYGEMLFARALHADYHTVETVAHARAAAMCVPDATFVLDIGGQDMKAIWLDKGVLTDIVVNEACSAGCGSFLEGFAANLHIPVDEIARAAFRSEEPASLGSRCTVFMNSSVVSEQRRGKGPDDIMAGLCRSIIENVFTKVIRVSNLDRLGDRIVVQGGTFRNDAVLRAFEQYLGRPVTRAPHPGLMGAIGVALLAAEHATGQEERGGEACASSFIGLDAMEGFAHEEYAGVTCRRCGNHCSRTVIAFSDGSLYVTGNRCPRGEEIDWAELTREVPDAVAPVQDPKGSDDPAPGTRGLPADDAEASARPKPAANLFDERERLLFQNWPCTPVAPARGVTIGIPRVLEFWDNMPFWSTMFRALGFTVRISRPSTRRTFERGLAHVTSDTICFPAKLVHGHVRELVDAHVDRIFMPIITTVPTENTAKTSEWMCAVVKGYPYVMKNSDNPEERYGVPFDAPLFHWYTDRDRVRQLTDWLGETFGVSEDAAHAAIRQGDEAQHAFADRIQQRGQEVLDQVHAAGTYAVVMASRPYHNDPLVNHGLPKLFCNQGIPVLTPDAVPGVRDVDLSKSRLDIVNNFHARMLSAAVIAASSPDLEYVQLVSFGCGHDAYLSDEIVRLMREISGKAPLILKIDESDATGPLRIRVRSFIETTERRRRDEAGSPAASSAPRELPDPYEVKYVREDRKRKVVLVPNTSHAFCRLMTAAMRREGVRADPLPVGREEAIRLGKRYVHNDICFPAQITIGESLAALESGKYDSDEVAIVTGKYIGDCRLTHYMPLLRRALDDAGYANVPVLTNDDVDAHDAHPGFRLSLPASLEIAWGLPMIDALEALLRRMRPYELEPGAADRAFDAALDEVIHGIEDHGLRGAEQGFKRAIEIMKQVPYDRSNPRPTVLIVGEYLLNFHPGANHEIERYLEQNGLEIIEARMTDVIRKSYFYKHAQSREYHVDIPLADRVWYATADNLFDIAHDRCDRIAKAHPLYEPPVRMPELVKVSDDVLHHTFDAGEGVLIPAEILENAARGCRAFVILQPFGCLPNHVVGRGLVRALKERYPDAQILPLDYDPDVSFANVENRLQMLIMNARERGNAAAHAEEAPNVGVGAVDEGADHGTTA
ncbi:acyl-CoA dehydratase activase [Collinsella sp. An2]|uniref:acyl-CoA dehydratase activase n=1 Tax=Collinsella sp. An2 TaxID=1965585 RepID=UPI000B378B65|nr:acyl-CoA dehydratase activase [Collinsella sp. An2]OUP11038.1 activase [Collinsella sp. An2]